jgi:hypothetical protein
VSIAPYSVTDDCAWAATAHAKSVEVTITFNFMLSPMLYFFAGWLQRGHRKGRSACELPIHDHAHSRTGIHEAC